MVKFLILFLLGFAFAMPTFSQNIIQGVVHDSNNNPIADVNIKLLSYDKTSSLGATISNNKGEYQFSIPIQANYVIIGSKVGYLENKKDITINSIKTIVPIQLLDDVKQLEEVVIKSESLSVSEKNDII